LRLEKVLQQALTAVAAELGIAAEVVATRRELSALARGARDLPVLRGWRRRAAGERLLAALAC
jgi:ribonuclease D